MNIEVVPVVAITVICYLIGMLCKASEHFPDKWIPVVMGVFGAGIGMEAWLSVPEFPADSWLTALEVGIASGLAATGVNQIYKQASKEDKTNE